MFSDEPQRKRGPKPGIKTGPLLDENARLRAQLAALKERFAVDSDDEVLVAAAAAIPPGAGVTLRSGDAALYGSSGGGAAGGVGSKRGRGALPGSGAASEYSGGEGDDAVSRAASYGYDESGDEAEGAGGGTGAGAGGEGAGHAARAAGGPLLTSSGAGIGVGAGGAGAAAMMPGLMSSGAAAAGLGAPLRRDPAMQLQQGQQQRQQPLLVPPVPAAALISSLAQSAAPHALASGGSGVLPLAGVGGGPAGVAPAAQSASYPLSSAAAVAASAADAQGRRVRPRPLTATAAGQAVGALAADSARLIPAGLHLGMAAPAAGVGIVGGAVQAALQHRAPVWPLQPAAAAASAAGNAGSLAQGGALAAGAAAPRPLSPSSAAAEALASLSGCGSEVEGSGSSSSSGMHLIEQPRAHAVAGEPAAARPAAAAGDSTAVAPVLARPAAGAAETVAASPAVLGPAFVSQVPPAQSGQAAMAGAGAAGFNAAAGAGAAGASTAAPAASAGASTVPGDLRSSVWNPPGPITPTAAELALLDRFFATTNRIMPCVDEAYFRAALEEARYYDAPAGDGAEGDAALLENGDMEGDVDVDEQSVVDEDDSEARAEEGAAGGQASKQSSPAAVLPAPEVLHRAIAGAHSTDPGGSRPVVGAPASAASGLTITAPAAAESIGTAARKSGDSSGDSSGAGSRSGGSKSQSPATSGRAGRRLQSRIQRYAEAFGAWCH